MGLCIRNDLRQPAILHDLIPESWNCPEILTIYAADGTPDTQKPEAFLMLDPPFNIIILDKVHPWVHL